MFCKTAICCYNIRIKNESVKCFLFIFIFIFSRPVIEVFFQCIQDIVVVLTKKKKNTFKGLNLNIITDMNVLSTKTITDKDNGIALHPWLILRPI